MIRCMFTGCLLLLLPACANLNPPRNWSDSSYAPHQLPDTAKSRVCQRQSAISEIAGLPPAAKGIFSSGTSLLAKGDTIKLDIAGDQDFYSRGYIIGANGQITLPDAISFKVAGQTIAETQKLLRDEMLRNGLIRDRANNVSVTLSELSEAEIAVSGAVFKSGSVFVGMRSAEVRNIVTGRSSSGDHNGSRTLSQAVRAAGGLRPDADISRVILVRQGHWRSMDLRGAIKGHRFDDIQLTSGDQIVVPSLGCFQNELVRPTRFTLPGIRVFMSNLSRPAASNAASAIGKETTSLPYGTRLSQAMVAANCVGGSALNARRRVVLMSRNPLNGQSIVISRGVEDLVRDADRDRYDPYLMPGDALACYDSNAMNFRDVLSLVGEVASPYFLINNLD